VEGFKSTNHAGWKGRSKVVCKKKRRVSEEKAVTQRDPNEVFATPSKNGKLGLTLMRPLPLERKTQGKGGDYTNIGGFSCSIKTHSKKE